LICPAQIGRDGLLIDLFIEPKKVKSKNLSVQERLEFPSQGIPLIPGNKSMIKFPQRIPRNLMN